MRRYYLYRRRGIYYAKLTIKASVPLAGRSTKTRDRDEALLIVADWLKNGVPTGQKRIPKPIELAVDLPTILRAIRNTDLNTEEAMTIVKALRERDLIDFGIAKSGPGREGFIHFLSRFWNIEQSPYLKDKLAHGHKITQKYCREAKQKIEKHFETFFGDSVPIRDITREYLRNFSIVLHDKGLTSSTINNIMIIGNKALNWAFIEGIIPTDPTEGLTTFVGEERTRDILTEEEIELLFQTPWQDKRAYNAGLLSLTTGIRSGEIRALKQNSIGETVLDVSSSWNDYEGIKRPKNGDTRQVPLLPKVRTLLLNLLTESPWINGQENPYIFYGENSDHPCSGELFRRNLNRAIKTTRNSPIGWKKEPPAGSATLWVVSGKKDTQGNLVDAWSEPEAVSNAKGQYDSDDGTLEYMYKRAEQKPDKPVGIIIGERKIDFHSFRHIYASRMANRMAADKVAKVTGHRSKAAAKIYQDHVTSGILKEATDEAQKEFGNVLQYVSIDS